MKNEIMMFVLLGMILLSVSSVSAFELNPFAEKKIYEPTLTSDVSDFIKQDFNEKYGIIKLSKTLFWIETDKIAEYSLVENTEQCLINCEARGKAVLYSHGKLFDDLNFIDKKGMNLDINAKYLIKTIETYEVEVPDTYKEVCEKDVSNETEDLLLKEESSCYQVVDTYKTETRENEVWVEYKGEELKAGDYEWKVQGTKSPTKAIDFIPTARGKTLNEWAWWDGDWTYKREIKIKENSGSALSNYTTLFYIPYDSDMQADFDDLRFVDSAETTELGYWIENKTDSNFAYVWVKIPSLTASINSTIYMYYGNSGASSNSNGNNAFLIYDDFNSGSLNTTLWEIWTTSGDPTITFTEGYVQIAKTGSYTVGGIKSKTQFNFTSPFFMKTRVMAISGGLRTLGTKTGTTTDSVGISMGDYISAPSEGWQNVKFDNVVLNLPNSRVGNQWVVNEYYNYGTTSKVIINGTLTNVSTQTNPSTQEFDLSLFVVRWTIDASNRWDYIILGNYASSEPTYYILDEQLPEEVAIEYVTPPTLENYANITQKYVPIKVNVTYTSSSFINITYSLRNINGTNYTQFYENETYDINFTDIPDAHYHYDVEVCAEGESLAIICETTETRRFTIDSTAPTIDLSYPTALIDYGAINQTLQLNFTATDTNLDKVWYNYNGTNVTIAGAVSGVANLSNITLSSKKNITIYANDTAGNIKTEVFGWDYRYFETNTSFNTPVLATSSQTFRLIGEKHSTVTGLTAILFYDGTARASTVVTSGNNVNFTNSFEIPAGTATRNFFWEITATTTNGTVVFNTSTQTQTVQNITFSTCETPIGLAYNLTTYDTTTGLPVNSTFEATFSYYASGGTGLVLAEYNYQNLSENRSNYLFCLNSSGLNVTIDAFISYGATGYDKRDYIIDNGIIGNFTVAIPLYLTQTLLTDVVTITVENQNYDRVAGALVTIQKWNVGTNTYSTIGMFTTSSSGTGIVDLELYNTWYRAIVTINGVIVHVTDIQKLGSTDWPITINLGIQNPYDLFGTISQGLEYDNTTQIVTYSWADSSGYVNTACLTVRKPSGSGYTILYNDCVDTVAGSINYQFLLNGTYEVYGTVYLTAEYGNISQVGDFMTITIGTPEITQVSSPYGKLISFIIIGTSGLVGISLGSPILGIFLLIGGMWGASMMGWLKGIEAIIWGIITVAIVILARQSRRGS